ncbi:MAG: class I SAM-dependent methyltransferase [Candidatus Andeanibacterium colombiense]|uniref:Class I SAM-dependent methyltransferase n=1 Tax=Candidatus Andeanibacterium colombiense TaxID=3121345 RepID=A0AAJ5XBA8_9SPHN|nr:MAG: class I SAM-dependent methyltransferase [Sphingomonadaceae bacterium]
MILNGYALTDARSRRLKARKIEALLGGDISGLALLDLGSGSGLLADYFQSRGANVTAADRDRETYLSDAPFTRIEAEDLPFNDATFDIVVFNHVIEHVGREEQQRAVLREIRRVLKPGGRLYLAVPNKWAIVEPHFRLPLLGALPRPIADRLVRLFRQAPEYDCFPLSRSELLRLLSTAFPKVRDVSTDAVHWVVENELTGLPKHAINAVPAWLIRLIRPAFPTFIMIGHAPAP